MTALYVLGLVASGCGSQLSAAASAEHAAAISGNPGAEFPTLGSLPELDDAKRSTRTKAALGLAQQVLMTSFPAPPADRRYAQLQAWIEREVTPWVSARHDALDEVRFEFGLRPDDATASDETILARAVLGILQEDTALALQRIPSPLELDSEPDIAQMFRELVQTQAQPFRSAARENYARCANAGYTRGDALRPFAKYCHARFDRLKAHDDPRTARR